ncbi:hypothetical protein BCR44DRAFT_49038 [Catenaria anguillulae PL171]|uniref:FAD/NAD(P)-binding domain-containing protein n=1 Tax=Catenaria anguillulae PL171 TaxID=765915 RepID=A0A1Y2HSI3_9FUNG|nr:hypothetical protein BCR44DRAFT_49038 [Catenaria anguillulae PL171]
MTSPNLHQQPTTTTTASHCLILGGGYAGIQAFKNTIRLLRIQSGCQCRPTSSRPAAFDCATSSIELLTDYLPPLLAHAARSALPAPDYSGDGVSTSTATKHSHRRKSNLSHSKSDSNTMSCLPDRDRPRVHVKLITGSTHYFHMVATPRAVAAGHDPDKLLFPYESLIPSPCTCQAAKVVVDGELCVATITRVESSSVEVREGGTLRAVPFDFCVIALGSGYPFPWKVPFDWPRAKVHEAVKQYQHVIRDVAKHIVVVGSGVVGVEVAAELASEYPSKRIIMFGPASHGSWGDRYNSHVTHALKHKHVQHIATAPGSHVDMNQSFGLPPNDVASPWLIQGPAAVKSTDGSTLALIGSDADDVDILVIDCTGLRSQLVPMSLGGVESHAQQKDIAVDEYLRVSGTHGRLFAAGDMCRPPVPAGKLAYVAAVQGNIVAANLARSVVAHVTGQEGVDESKLTRFSSLPDLAVVTLGRGDGVTVLPYIGVPPLGASRIGAVAFKGDGGYRTARPLIGKSMYERRSKTDVGGGIGHATSQVPSGSAVSK